MDQAEVERTVAAFYRTGRAGACRLSDGGGPFGFDIAVALVADEVITGYRCDAIAETGATALSYMRGCVADCRIAAMSPTVSSRPDATLITRS